MNTNLSLFYTIQGLFCSGSDGELLAIEGQNADQIAKHWSVLRTQMSENVMKSVTLPSGTRVDTTFIDHSDMSNLCSYSHELHVHTVREIYHKTKGCYIGLLSCQLRDTNDENAAFRDWLEIFFLLENSLLPSAYQKNLQDSSSVRITQSITTLFENKLRNVSSNDEWSIGRDLFTRRVLDFVVRGERIQMAVPAFPCKSPNQRKVGGRHPDMAERIALQTLHTFSQMVKKIYPPGVAIWIISDGHVFSDCIGVDDQIVLDYDHDLQKAYRSMFNSTEDREAIRFRGLIDIFFSNSDVANTFCQSWSQKFHIAHPINSNLSAEAETARKVMMAGCQSPPEHFQKLIADQHAPTLSLYRGQARFMQDDLAAPDFLAKSTKQRKKTSFVVALEMISRNQAYSNLLELLLPNYVRLSIHAHSNRGPKFGICLFPRNKVRAIDSIQNRHELVPAYEFQVPTPWHNSIIKITGDDTIYLGKAEIVQAVIEQGDYEGGWVEDNGVGGGHFALTPVSKECISSPTMECSLSTVGGGGEDVYVGDNNKPSTAIGLTEIMEIAVVVPVQERNAVRPAGGMLRGKSYRPLFDLPLRFLRRVARLRESAGAAAAA